MRIANNNPLEGAPRIHMPSVYGIPTGKQFFYRIPVAGKKDISIKIENLPEWISFDGKIIRGYSNIEEEIEIQIHAENSLGADKKAVTLKIGRDVMGLTPLMGFTSWNAYCEYISDITVREIADNLVNLGLCELGYSYVNIDSGWQDSYGGELDAIQPNKKFSDMKDTVEYIHNLGLKAGIYCTPMKTAWGCPDFLKSIPGCTRGESDILFANVNGGIGKEHMEQNNAKQWGKWEFDYLKYDWVPTIPTLAEKMKVELEKLSREMLMCVTVRASQDYGEYWSKRINSWRNNDDSLPNWKNIKDRLNTVKGWEKYVREGHYYDLDMLEIGKNCMNNFKKDPNGTYLTDEEELFSFTMRAFFSSPIQLSNLLTELTEFEFNMITNEEVLAVNQSQFVEFPRLISEADDVVIYAKTMDDNSTVYAIFNRGDNIASGEIGLDGKYHQRDLWAREDIGTGKTIKYSVEPHCASLISVK